jgi:hypothetical protein
VGYGLGPFPSVRGDHGDDENARRIDMLAEYGTRSCFLSSVDFAFSMLKFRLEKVKCTTIET